MKTILISILLLNITFNCNAQYSNRQPDKYFINKHAVQKLSRTKIYYTDAIILIAGITSTFILTETASTVSSATNKALIGTTTTLTVYTINKIRRKLINRKFCNHRKRRINKFKYY